MALVLCKGKPYSPPVLHGYTFECRGAEDEFPGPTTLWGAEVEEKDFHKFLLGVEGSPFFLEDATVVIPPPPTNTPVVEDPAIVVPGAVPTKDPAAAAALALAAAASGALNTDAPPPAGDVAPPAGDQVQTPGPSTDTPPPAGDAPDARAEAYAPFAALRSKVEIAALAKASYGMEMDPEASKMADMLEAVKAEIATRIPPVEPQA